VIRPALPPLTHLDAEQPSGRVDIGADVAVLPDRDAVKARTLAAKPRIGGPDLKGDPARCKLQDVRLERVRHVHPRHSAPTIMSLQATVRPAAATPFLAPLEGRTPSATPASRPPGGFTPNAVRLLEHAHSVPAVSSAKTAVRLELYTGHSPRRKMTFGFRFDGVLGTGRTALMALMSAYPGCPSRSELVAYWLESKRKNFHKRLRT
jgi:hypothetical protein